MADEFGAFSSAFPQTSKKSNQRESAWASWPTFQEDPPPIDDFDDEDDDEFGKNGWQDRKNLLLFIATIVVH